MINSINIKNYRNLKSLTISSLEKVNLITGKNNTGKSTVLEAIALFASKGDPYLIYQLLGDRGENFRQSDSTKNPTEYNIRSLSSLFSDRVVGFEIENTITIGMPDETLFGEQSTDQALLMRFVRYHDEVQSDSKGVTTRKRTILDSTNEKQIPIFKFGFEIKMNDSSFIISLDEERTSYRFGNSIRNIGGNNGYQFIRTRNIDREINGKLFDNIALTEKEEYVIDALKIIEESTERIAFVEESVRERTAVIKIKDIRNILPLRSMGDGINRILTIILALVNCDKGYLLIDEFENGLHYSVQEQLWEIIFTLSEKLNIQVFATTHSEDCIRGFENVLNNRNSEFKGKLIRLENNNGTIQQIEFNAEELKVATDQDIETR